MTVKRWTNEDEEFLKHNFMNMSNKDLAQRFKVTSISIQRKLSRLGLIRQVQKKWTKVEEKYLRDNFQTTSDLDLADHFMVTEIAIKRKLNRLGLKRTGNISAIDSSRGRKPKQKISGAPKKEIISEVFKSETSQKPEAVEVNPDSSPDLSSATSERKRKTRAKASSNPSLKKADSEAAKPKAVKAIRPKPVDPDKIPSSDRKQKFEDIELSPMDEFQDDFLESADFEADFEETNTPVYEESEFNDLSTYPVGKRAKMLAEHEYQAFKTYTIGETIYHKVWKDKGKVIKKFATSGGNSAIVVDFSKLGKKILLEGCDAG